jgi:hypothetical protein
MNGMGLKANASEIQTEHEFFFLIYFWIKDEHEQFAPKIFFFKSLHNTLASK